MLAEQANGPTGSSSVGQAAQAVEGAGRQAVGTAEDLGSKAVDGLKSAAVDFFKDMDWKHLSGARAQPANTLTTAKTLAYARSSAPNRSFKTVTIRSIVSATSSAVSVRSGSRKSMWNARLWCPGGT